MTFSEADSLRPSDMVRVKGTNIKFRAGCAVYDKGTTAANRSLTFTAPDGTKHHHRNLERVP